ncbi:MAG: reverse transcriptase/maturase family protein [Oscillospiraceae bacterium]|nr:reverse transcriptase/maturase family protein [Oscillospiraceae bacterium]
MSNLLYEKLCDYRLLKYSYEQTIKGSRKYRRESIIFDMAREKNLIALWRSLKDETYTHGSYHRFSVIRPKVRLVSAPRLRDKIVQYAVHTILWSVYCNVFIPDTYACLKDRGAHRAVERVQHYMRKCQWQHGDCWIVKADITKYFYSIDREVLKRVYRKQIKDDKFLRLLDIIVDSSPEETVGIPLGNVTSQDFAGIYLNELDQYVKRFLGVKFYVRYMDDLIIMMPTKEEAAQRLEQIERFLRERLHLSLNTKTRIFPAAQGVNAYGYKIHATHKLVRNSSKAGMKRRIKVLNRKYRAGEIPLNTIQHSVNSWLGHARHSNSYNLAKKIFAPYGYIQVRHPKYRFGVRLDAH